MRAISLDDLRRGGVKAEMLAPALIVAALAAWYLAPWPAARWVWAVVYAGLVWRWPRWALALLPLTFPFWFAPVAMTARLTFPLSELALAAIALVVVAKAGAGLRRWWPQRIRFARAYLARLGGPVVLGALLLLAGMTIGVVIARAPQAALRAWRWEITEPLVYAALLVWALRRRWLWRSLWAFVASGALVASLALAQLAFAHVTFAPLGAGGGLKPYPAWSGLDWRATAIIYGSPNTAGAWMARALPLALAVALWPRASRAWARWLAAGALAALLSGLALTGSRGAWLGAVAGAAMVGGLGWWAWGPHPAYRRSVPLRGEGHGRHSTIEQAQRTTRERRPQGQSLPVEDSARQHDAEGQVSLPLRNTPAADSPSPRRRGGRGVRSFRHTIAWLTAITLAAALIYGTSSLWLAPLVGLAGSAHGGSGEERLLVWRAAQTMGRDHPLLGVGPDQFLYYYDPAYTSHPYLIATINGRPSATGRLPNLSHPHNLGLELWLSAGVIGLVGYMLALVGAIWRGGLTPWPPLPAGRGGIYGEWIAKGQAGIGGVVAVGVIGALAGGLAHGLVDSAYFEPDYALAFWWGVAALVALGRAGKRPARGA